MQSRKATNTGQALKKISSLHVILHVTGFQMLVSDFCVVYHRITLPHKQNVSLAYGLPRPVFKAIKTETEEPLQSCKLWIVL